MITVTGKIEDTTGAALHATIDFVSRSTPLAGSGIVTTNTDTRILSNPSDGTFSVALAPGNYTVTIAANGQTTSFNIAVLTGTGTAAIDTLVTTPLAYTYVAPNTVWNGQWAGNITFLPLSPPPAPTISQITFAGGNINTTGSEHYSYWVSYLTQTGETFVSATATVHLSGPTSNLANRVALTPNIPGVTNIRIWRTHVDTGHNYDATSFPAYVGLLATVSPSTAHYDDWESSAQFAARVDAAVPPLYNTTAGQLLSSNGTVCAFITDQGLFFPGANCRIKPGVGLQIYNFTTSKWYSLLVTGALGAEQLGFDSGNPN
jgi:hypothetical protein